ncbi:CAF1-domain-containing protein [Microthyrium microscopicum]|uniref:poly(A)-specific ribonuclease n=1 Tax=Microthyrium microscopicum TaxID=703497 RepID=A0A6A6U4N1_9PEZI|nr:CAF1-domain-containing protein [Microthyrium microscopicum]
MKPAARGYPPQNLGNTFSQLHQQPGPHQTSHIQQHPSLQHNFSAHHAFASQSSIFGPQGTNGANGGSSNLHAGFGGGGGLGGQSAQMAFGHGGLQQQLQQAHEPNSNVMRGQAQRIREVWKGNLAEEMAVVRMLIDKYPYISMDTEFPGVVARPIAEDFGSKSAFHYQTMRCNVDLLKLIQLGITLFTVDGEMPPPDALNHVPRSQLPANMTICPCTWSFNFKFSLDEDMYNEASIRLLKDSGVDFEKHNTNGIDVEEFGSLLITSGLTFSNDVHWISFHGGYDFGYLFKVMWNRGLPQDEEHYRRLIKKFFPNILDVKFLLNSARRQRDRGTVNSNVAKALESFGQKPGLQDIADDLGLTRVGISHTAGSDAWLTGLLFFEVRKRVFDDQIPEEYNGQMWGLTGIGPPASTTAQAAALALHQNQAAAAANGMAYHTAGAHHREGGPSTPTTNPTGLVSTPSQGFSSMTPGAGGAFGNFQPTMFSRRNNSPGPSSYSNLSHPRTARRIASASGLSTAAAPFIPNQHQENHMPKQGPGSYPIYPQQQNTRPGYRHNGLIGPQGASGFTASGSNPFGIQPYSLKQTNHNPTQHLNLTPLPTPGNHSAQIISSPNRNSNSKHHTSKSKRKPHSNRSSRSSLQPGSTPAPPANLSPSFYAVTNRNDRFQHQVPARHSYSFGSQPRSNFTGQPFSHPGSRATSFGSNSQNYRVLLPPPNNHRHTTFVLDSMLTDNPMMTSASSGAGNSESDGISDGIHSSGTLAGDWDGSSSDTRHSLGEGDGMSSSFGGPHHPGYFPGSFPSGVGQMQLRIRHLRPWRSMDPISKVDQVHNSSVKARFASGPW